jgi:hypothetical protein
MTVLVFTWHEEFTGKYEIAVKVGRNLENQQCCG